MQGDLQANIPKGANYPEGEGKKIWIIKPPKETNLGVAFQELYLPSKGYHLKQNRVIYQLLFEKGAHDI